MLREVVLTDDKSFQQLFLKRIYEWFIKNHVAIGLFPKEQASEANEFLNPA